MGRPTGRSRRPLGEPEGGSNRCPHKLLANTGQQSGSDWVAIPDDLTDGGASFRTWFVPQSGQSPNQPTAP